MEGGRDIRSMMMKLLKAHHMRYMNFWKEPDPQTGVEVTLLKFRRDKEHNPKAFFDSINETGLQYKKLSKDPDALEIVCELWPRGAKGKMTEMRQDAGGGVGTGKGSDQGESGGSPGGSLRYIQLPNGEANAKMVQSVAEDLLEAGFEDEASELLLIGKGGQDWDEFSRKISHMFRRLKLHKRPEIRQIREQVANEIVSTMGLDAELFSGMRGSDLEKKINDVVQDNIDLILDTRGIADSVLRRTASSATSKVARMRYLRRGVRMVAAIAADADESSAQKKASRIGRDLDLDIYTAASGGGRTCVDINSPFMVLLAERDIEGAYLLLLDL